MSEQLEPFEVFIASLSEEQQKVFWKELQNADFYDIMEDHLFQNQYVKMIAAKEKIDSMRAVESVSDVEQGETDAESDKDSCSENSFPSSSAKDVMEDNLDDMVEQLEDLQKRSPNNIEILLLGESGVGKSTMINAFSNYMKYLTYKTAENNSLQVHVKGTFTLVDNEMNSCVFDFGPKVPSSTDNNDISKSIKAYEVPISEKLPAKSITFLDTAGFGSDSDATESEFEEALEFARNGRYDAVLIFLQPNMARLTPFLQIFLRRTLEACKASKVYFCFTKLQMTMYRFGETFSVLKSFLVDRKSELVDGLEKRCFCFENESFKYLRVRKEKGFLLHESQIRGLTTSWNHSKQTMFKLLDSIISKIEERKPEPEPEKDVEPAVDSDLSPPPPKLPRLEESKKPIEQYTQDLDARFLPHKQRNLLNEWKQEPTLYGQENIPDEFSLYITKLLDSKYVIEVRSWINADNKIAVQKLKELQKANQLPPKLLPDRIVGFVQQETQQPELDHLPNCTNILILGETGVGKSTFINGMGKEWDIAVKPKDSPHWDKNEAKDVGESATQKPMSYTFSLPGKREKYIRIIDTPGIGDTRGINQDEMNFEEIMSYIADYPKIHAILFLVAPNEARLKVSFRYGIQELLARLHRTAVDNVIFCFTKSRGNQYKAGESYPILQSLLAKLGERGSAVHLNKETSYFFDSESFRYLAAKKQGFTFTDIEHRDYKESWQKAVNETQRLFKYIFTLQPHDVNETLCVNNTKKVIQMLSKPLGDITKNILANESLLNDKKKAVEHMIKAGDDLQNKLFVEQIVLEAEELKNPQTVCTAQSCVEHGTVGGKTHTTIYKTICDPDCGHTGIQAEVLPNPNLSDCKAFENGKCKKCGCSWELHMHIRSRTNQVTISVMDDKVQKDITANLTKKEEADSFIRFLEIKIKEETNHKETILEHCAEFAAFVAQNSMLAVNDAYNEYLKYLIKEEKDKENSSDSLILAELERYAHAYEEQSKLLISARKTKRSEQKTVDDINKMINDLKESDFCGSFLEEIQYLQVVSVRTSAKNRSKKIVLTNWKEDLKWLLEKPVKKTKKFFN